MMLSATPSFSSILYAPTRPSPLSERPANVLSHTFKFNMASPQPTDKKPVPQRSHKPNPVMQTRDQATQRRRDMYFRRVQKDRDDRKWEVRGEQIQRLDFISDQKRWEAEKARQAPKLEENDVDEEFADDLPSYSVNNLPDVRQELSEADYILQQEEHELQALIASMEEVEQEQEQMQDNASQHYGSDDEDYDRLFMEYTSVTDLDHARENDLDAMDMTDG